jgi:hypothetical protein
MLSKVKGSNETQGNGKDAVMIPQKFIVFSRYSAIFRAWGIEKFMTCISWGMIG